MKKIVNSVIVAILTSLIVSGLRIGLNAVLSKNVLFILTAALVISLVFLAVVIYVYVINKKSGNHYKFLKQGMKFGLKDGGTVTFDHISIFRPDYIHYITADGKKGVVHYSLIYIYL